MPEVQRPADLVTATRAALAVAVAVVGPTGPGLALVVVALGLDWVDGRVARRTGTASAFGARFDMEVDAFLILVLSAYAAPRLGRWVLLIGAARYLLWLAERVLPWLRRPVPPRHWRKVVAAVQGVSLAVACSYLLPVPVAQVLLAAALALLAESFGRDVWWLWRSRASDVPYPVGGGATLLAMGVVWLALVLPPAVADVLRLPVDALVVVAVALLPWRHVRLAAATVVGVVLALAVVLHVADAGFRAVLGRPVDPLTDWSYLGPAVGVLGDSVGVGAARTVATLAAVAVAALLVALPVATVRTTGALHARRRTTLGVAAVLVLAAVTQVGSAGAAGLAYAEVRRVRADLADQRAFAPLIAADDVQPGRRGLLDALRGDDVLVVFVESYGRVAVTDGPDHPYAAGVVRVLDSGTRRLRAAGWHSRSAYLTSPTFGAASWLAHATLQSGLWVDSQRRYDQLLGADRTTLSSAFAGAGWRTVIDVPANTRDWPEGRAFYGVDHVYDSRDVGYRGPRFGYAPMPDQFTLDRFQRLELAPAHRRPVMAEIDLVSSHHPWAPSPLPVPWRAVGDGSVFTGAPTQPDSAGVGTRYGRSVEYTMATLTDWVARQRDHHLVLLVLGDHQPHSYVTGPDPGHDVPVSLLTRDPEVLGRVAGWGWQPGLRPGPDAPVWPMDAVRDRFLAAFSSAAAAPGGRRR